MTIEDEVIVFVLVAFMVGLFIGHFTIGINEEVYVNTTTFISCFSEGNVYWYNISNLDYDIFLKGDDACKDMDCQWPSWELTWNYNPPKAKDQTF